MWHVHSMPACTPSLSTVHDSVVWQLYTACLCHLRLRMHCVGFPRCSLSPINARSSGAAVLGAGHHAQSNSGAARAAASGAARALRAACQLCMAASHRIRRCRTAHTCAADLWHLVHLLLWSLLQVPIVLSHRPDDWRVLAGAYLLPPLLGTLLRYGLFGPLMRRHRLQQVHAPMEHDFRCCLSCTKGCQSHCLRDRA